MQTLQRQTNDRLVVFALQFRLEFAVAILAETRNATQQKEGGKNLPFSVFFFYSKKKVGKIRRQEIK